MIRLSELNQSPREASSLILQRISASVDFLSQLIDPETGQMPVYGSNDGALILPLNNCDFTDYRPLLQLGSYLTRQELLFEHGPWDEDLFWFYGEEFTAKGKSNLGVPGGHSFPNGGVHILRGANSKAVIRCTDFRSRPSHADQLHVDLWMRGKNIACDAGTYLYSGGGVWRNGLAHTAVHNTVIVDHQNQMNMVSRFTWTNWATGNVLRHEGKIWQGEHDGYQRLHDPVDHKRTVLSLDENRWLVVDHLNGKQNHHYALHWLLDDLPYEQGENFLLLSPGSEKHKVHVGLLGGASAFSVVRAALNSTRGWRSRYYGEKEPAISAMLETNLPRVCFWTFFGFEKDVVQIEGETFKLISPELGTSINLQSLITNS